MFTHSGTHMLTRTNRIVAIVAVLAASQVMAEAQRPAALELRSEAAVIGSEVRLRQVARWSRRDAAVFTDLGELVVARFSPGNSEMSLEVTQVRELLEGAGVSPADIVLRGASKVAVTRLDARSPDAQRAPILESKELAELLDTKAPAAPQANATSAGPRDDAPQADAQQASGTTQSPSTQPSPASSLSQVSDLVGQETLKQALSKDLAERLSLPVEDVELTFDPADEKLLRAQGPVFNWAITAVRASNLGPVRWSVTIWTGKNASASRKVQLEAKARAWKNALVLRKALSSNQVLREEDFEEKRLLLERMPDSALLTREQALTMQSNRPLPPGTVLTARTLDPVLLVRTGQVVNVTLSTGPIEIRAVAKALDGGCYGNTIRVKNEETNEILSVTVTGPQEARVGPR